ncbi:hypothetical protein KR074_006735 [Drosophila pseudoananassae]|nr:hypothetical protein KR074_006735 [Drosophila pseudoananassae]
MSWELMPYPEPEKIFLVAYEMKVPEGASPGGLLPLVTLKAEHLKVRGYITQTHCGRKVGGELEGREEDLKQMMEWLMGKARPKVDEDASSQQMAELRFSPWKLQSGAKYADFFYC